MPDFVDDDAGTVMRKPAPTLPPDASQEFEACDGFLAAPGRVVGERFTLREKIAQGTFGVVYVARDRHLGRDVAVKLLHAAHVANTEIVQRFLLEARAAGRIVHPGIVTMYDCGRIGDSAFIAMELLHGESLTARLEKCGRLAPVVAIELAKQIASAIAAAHEAGVLHRDLKPDNIFLVPDATMPGGERAVVLDFGLAKLGDANLTALDDIFGTPRYMSPEQCRSAKWIDHRSDIYALGCILFELVAGRPPYEGGLRELVRGHQTAPIPRASSFSLEVSAALDDLILQLLQKDPNLRPQSMAVVARMLSSVEHDVATHVAAERVAPTLMPFRAPRRRVPIVAAAIAFFVAGALTALAVRGPAQAAASDDRVMTERPPSP